MPIVAQTFKKPLEITVAKLRALAAFASTDADRPHITQVWLGPDFAAATNGHRLLRVRLPADAERGVGLAAADITRCFAGYKPRTRVRILGTSKGGEGIARRLDVEVLEDVRTDKGARYGDKVEIVLGLKCDFGFFPPIDQVLPKWFASGAWPEMQDRVVKPHAIDINFIEGLGEVWRAFFTDRDSGSFGAALLEAAGPLDPVIYGRKTDEAEVIVVLMPMRIES